MNNNDLSLINLSEIRFLTGDTGERENADAMMQERGLLTDKGNPSVSGIAEQNEHYTPLLLKRLSFKLQFRENSFECVRNTYLLKNVLRKGLHRNVFVHRFNVRAYRVADAA